METMSIDGLTLFYDADERDTAELIRLASENSVRLIHEHWGLDTPEDCRVYVMTSWLHFVLHSAPWHWRVLLAVSIPLWYFAVRRTWPYAGGWAQRYGKRQAVGVKPPRLLQLGDRSMGDQIFIREEEDPEEKVQHVTCHELVHAFAAHLKLPLWLNEGLAMVTVDRYFGKPTVRRETIEFLESSPHKTSQGRYRNLSAKDKNTFIYHFVRGYWLTRSVTATRPWKARWQPPLA